MVIGDHNSRKSSKIRVRRYKKEILTIVINSETCKKNIAPNDANMT